MHPVYGYHVLLKELLIVQRPAQCWQLLRWAGKCEQLPELGRWADVGQGRWADHIFVQYGVT